MKLFFPNWFAARWFAGRTLAGVSPAVFYSAVRIGETTEVLVATSLSEVAWYCWYVDGAYVGKTVGPTKSFQVPTGEQLRVECLPTADADFDPIANAPDGYPARRTLWWTRSLDANVAAYRVEQKASDGDWTTLAEVPPEADQWGFSVLTGRLDDLTVYTWRVTPIDAAGNEGTPITIGPETVVRTPDAPNFTAELDAETQTVEFAEAST
jgi:hypothetical protein